MGCGSSSEPNMYRKVDQSIWRGTLRVHLRKATIKKDHQMLGDMDPYVKLTFGKDEKKSTVCEDGGQFPEWKNESFTFTRTNEDDIVYIQLWNENLTGDDFLGEGGFALTKVRKDTVGKVDCQCELYTAGEHVGTLDMEIEFDVEEACKNHPEIKAPDTTGMVIIRPLQGVLQNDTSGWFSSMQPLVAVKLGDNEQVSGADCDGGQNPKWSDQLVFTRDTIARDTFIITLYNFSESSDNEFLGQGWLSITSALPLDVKSTKTVTVYFQGEIAGNVTFEMEFASDNPELYEENKTKPPVQQRPPMAEPPAQPTPVQALRPVVVYAQQGYIPPAKPQSGYGNWTYPNGAYYEGYWLQGRMNGKGRWSFNNKGQIIQYEGDFQNDMYHGQGRLQTPCEIYQGQFEMGKKSGHGTWQQPNSQVKFVGPFVNNVMHGEGEYTNPQGETKQALFQNNRFISYVEDNQFKNCLLAGRSLKQGQRLPSDNGQFTLTINGAGEIQLFEGNEIIFEIDEFEISEDPEDEEEDKERDNEIKRLEREEKRAKKREQKKKQRNKKKNMLEKGLGALKSKLGGKKSKEDKKKDKEEARERKQRQRELRKLRKQKQRDDKQEEEEEFQAPFFLKLNRDGELAAHFGKKKEKYWSTADDEGILCPPGKGGLKLVVKDDGQVCIVDKEGETMVTLFD